MNIRLDGLRLQLLGLFVIPVTLIVLAVAVMSTGVHRRAMRALVAQRDKRAAASAAAAIDEALSSRLTLLDLISNQLAAPGSPSLSPSEPSISGAFPLGLGFYDEQGNSIGAEDPFAEVAKIDVQSLESSTDRVLVARLQGETSALLFATGSSHTVVGAISLRDLLHAAAPTITVQQGAVTYLVAPGADLLLSLGGPPAMDLSNHPGVQSALRGESGSSFLSAADGERVIAFAPISSTGWGLIIEEPWESVASSVLNLSLIAPFSMVPILLLALLALWFGARRVIEPLRQLDEAAQRLPSGELETIDQPLGGIAEIEQLRETLLGMAQRVREAQNALRSYIGAITQAQEEERRRIARELHDESIQHWIALDHRLQMVATRLREVDESEAEILGELHREAQTGIRELRRLSRGLRPLYLEDLGLVAAVEMLASDAQESLGIPVQAEIRGQDRRLSAEVEMAVYRLVQEGLSNISHHAEASRAEIGLDFGKDRLEVTVEDNGRGFSPPEQIDDLAASGHFGLMGMKERADALGGDLHIVSNPGSGTTIKLTVPLSPIQTQK